MIKDKVVVKRYADAYMNFVKPGIGWARAVEEFKELKNVLIHENPGFMEFLTHEGIGHNDKLAFIDRVLDDNYSEELRSFLKLLIDKERINHLLDIAEYIRIYYSHGQEIEALLKTSFPLDIEVIKEIEDKLEKRLNRKFKFYIDLDASLLGGVQVTMGDNTVIDDSVRKRLAELKEKLRGAKVQ